VSNLRRSTNDALYSFQAWSILSLFASIICLSTCKQDPSQRPLQAWSVLL
jgi:hypothetical protein